MSNANDETKATDTQALALLGATSAAWAHRLGNTLGIVPIWIQRIEQNLDDKELVLSYLNKIQNAVEGQLGIARQLTNFARLSASSGIGPTPVNSVVQKTWDEHYKPSVEDTHSPSFRLELSPRLPDGRADEQLLGEVIRNLVDNSVKAVQNRVDGLITIKTHRTNRNIAIDISDNGIGIPPELAANLFQRPVPSNREEGLGIGLLISRTLVNSWGGELSLVESGNAGTTIRVSLVPWKMPSRIRELRRGLIVEDNAEWSNVLLPPIQERGLTVDVASSFEAAVRWIESNEYDLVLLDLRLNSDMDEQDRSGLNLARLVRERNPDALIVVMSGYVEYAVARDAFRAGVDEFLEKQSFSFEELNRVIDKLAVRRETQRESIRQSQLDKLMYEVLSMISHELRAPLLTIQRNIEALSIGAFGALREEQHDPVAAIRAAVRREFVLLNAHLDLNRIEEGAERLEYQEYDLVALVREEIGAHKSEADRKGVNLQTQLPERKAIVRIDVNRFRVALNPLLDNAIKFSPENSRVVIKAILSKNFVEVRVSDQGPGIKPAELEQLMRWQIDETNGLTQRIRSSGFGLRTAKRMIELQGGKLWIESDGKSGTTVRFRLPIKK